MQKVRGLQGEDEADIMDIYEAKCKEHPEYNDAQRQCLLYSLYHGKTCEVTDERIRQKSEYNVFVKENPTFVGMSEGNLRPLINEQDLKIKGKVISDVESAGKEKVLNYGTEQKMKKAIAKYKEVEPEEPKEKPIKKLWSKVEQAEYAQEVVRTFITNGVDPAVIRELIVKAIGVVEQE